MHLEIWRTQFIEYLQAHWASDDAAHDLHHLHRVWRTCQQLRAEEGGTADELTLLAACYFHDYVTLPKNSPDRHRASLLSADAAAEILRTRFPEFPSKKIPQVHHAIHAHSFSADAPTETLEAAILQDADRMEALGAIGIARLFYTAGKMGSTLFDPEDVMAEHRPLDDRRFALDHIEAKLLKLPTTMKTAAGRKLAENEAQYLCDFRAKMAREVNGS